MAAGDITKKIVAELERRLHSDELKGSPESAVMYAISALRKSGVSAKPYLMWRREGGRVVYSVGVQLPDGTRVGPPREFDSSDYLERNSDG